MNDLPPRLRWRRLLLCASLCLCCTAQGAGNHPAELTPLAADAPSIAPIHLAAGVPIRRVQAAPVAPLEIGDLDALRCLGRLRVLTPEPGEVRHADGHREDIDTLLDALAARLGLPIERVAVRTREELLQRLTTGAGDIIVGLAPLDLADRVPLGVRATLPLSRSRFQVVTARHSPLARLNGLESAFGRRLSLRADSPLWQRVDALTRAYPWVRFEASPLHLDENGLAAAVAQGTHDALVLPAHDAERVVAARDDLTIAFDIGDTVARHWYVRAGNERLLAELNAFLGQSHLAHRPDDRYRGDLPEIRRHGVLRAIVRPRAGSFEVVDGGHEGFDFRLLERLAKRLDLTLKTELAPSDAAALRWLEEGRGDLIAAPVALPQRTDFRRTLPYWYTAPMVVAPVWVSVETPGDLSGRRCLLPAGSPQRPVIEALLERGEADFELELSEDFNDEAVLRDALLDGPRAFTVMGPGQAERLLASTPDLAASLSLHDAASHRWVTRAGDLELASEINRMVREYWGSGEQTRLAAQFRPAEPSGGESGAVRRLSPFDDLARSMADSHGFDWRLIVAMMFEESGFDPEARSPVGALGLMQVLPATAATVGVRNLRNPSAGILAGVRYLDRMRGHFEAELPVKDRTWFAVASYHAGASRVERARERATELGLDPDRWFGHVEQAMLKLAEETRSPGRRGVYRHTVSYVREVRIRFDTYVQVTAPALAMNQPRGRRPMREGQRGG